MSHCSSMAVDVLNLYMQTCVQFTFLSLLEAMGVSVESFRGVSVYSQDIERVTVTHVYCRFKSLLIVLLVKGDSSCLKIISHLRQAGLLCKWAHR